LTRLLSTALPVLPTAALSAGFVAMAWREQGSVLTEDWLPYALATGLLLATLLASGTALLPHRGLLAGLAALTALAGWTALSAQWSPVPALARDEALLVLFYGFAVTVPLLTLRSDRERLAAIAIVILASVSLVVATCVRLLLADEPAELYWATRLASPIRYPGAGAALFLVSFWPALALAASRRVHVGLRTLAFGGAVALLAGWLMTQSRAAAVALAVSAVIVFVVTPARLRLLVPVTLVSAVAGAAYHPLTEPFLKNDSALEQSIRGAARWTLVLLLAGAAVGFVYAIADRRLTVSPRLTRAAGYTALVVAMLGVLGGLGGFVVAVDSPVGYVQNRWEEFKSQADRETGSSHLATFGSNRYDLWRVALDEFGEHPLRGAGGRAFGPAYLREGDTQETPLRSHSFVFDLLGETGVVGLCLLVAALLPFAWIVVHRARHDLLTAGIVGAAAYWLVQASGDWTWTFPAVGVPFFLLLGVGAASEDDRRLTSRAALPAGAALAVTALLVFAPPWLSTRYTARALEQDRADAADELRWARRLDPLSLDPLIAEAELASSPEQAIPPLEEAVEREPHSLGPRYVLGLTYLDAGRLGEARRELREALRLAPQSRRVRQALRRAEAAKSES
jgi:hypothetical protein